mmetsp:Transcript_30489/g.40279  ORF Transcript_30489/g.40279 Transcript_30489/m.40279 type:complete len:282 (+) Transcript_30489:183-1028(+)
MIHAMFCGRTITVFRQESIRGCIVISKTAANNTHLIELSIFLVHAFTKLVEALLSKGFLSSGILEFSQPHDLFPVNSLERKDFSLREEVYDARPPVFVPPKPPPLMARTCWESWWPPPPLMARTSLPGRRCTGSVKSFDSICRCCICSSRRTDTCSRSFVSSATCLSAWARMFAARILALVSSCLMRSSRSTIFFRKSLFSSSREANLRSSCRWTATSCSRRCWRDFICWRCLSLSASAPLLGSSFAASINCSNSSTFWTRLLKSAVKRCRCVSMSRSFRS